MKISTSHQVLGALLLLAATSASYADGAVKQIANVVGQGPAGPVVSQNGATLIRTRNGITIALTMPTPAPGTYNYPPANPFQTVAPVPGTPEVFTGWAFVFNHPERCAIPFHCVPGNPSALNDFAANLGDGGVYNFSGHAISGGGTLNLVGNLSVGETLFGGVTPLWNTAGAHVHVAVAPHGVLVPELLPQQINTPVGNPGFWWLAAFATP